MERENKQKELEFRISGKILYLTEDPNLLRAQIRGDVSEEEVSGATLKSRVSTDEIIPSRWCMAHSTSEGLSRYLLTGIDGVEPGDLKGKFQVVVAGKSFGRGSSREHAQLAFRGAGVDLIVADNFERIFDDNCRNYNIYTINSEKEKRLSVLEKQFISYSDLVSDLGPVNVEIVKHGGLFPYTNARLNNEIDVPIHRVDSIRPMTIAEKIIARNTRIPRGFTGVLSVKPGDELIVKTDKKYAYELQTIISQQGLVDTFGENAPVNPENTWLFEDHLALMSDTNPVTVRHRDAQREFAEKYKIKEYRADASGVEGICHTVMLEKHVLPGELVLGNDSHTCHLGVANVLAIGKGASEFGASLITNDIPVIVPETIRVVLKGRLRKGITATDAMLDLISRQEFKDGIASRKVLQFGGEGLNEIPVDEQATFTNMSIEGQAYTGIVEPNEKLFQFMEEKHGLSRNALSKMLVFPDRNAQYTSVVEVDLSQIERMAALPGDTQNGVPISEVKGKKIDFFYIGSCKNGDLNALRRAAEIFKNRHIAPGVKVQVQANTRDTENILRSEGIIDIFEKAGVEVIGRGCGPCMGATEDANEREETVLSATDRNFETRMGKKRKVILADEEVVAASSIKGAICTPEDL